MPVLTFGSTGHLRWFLPLCLLALLAGCSNEPDYSDVKVQLSPADGLTSSSLDSYYLQRLIDETREGADKRLAEVYERNKIPQAERYSRAKTEGRFDQLGNHRLAIIDLSYTANPLRVTRLVGIVQDQLISISCVSPGGATVVYASGESHCAEVVRYHFPSQQ
jgi:hypothetical protein